MERDKFRTVARREVYESLNYVRKNFAVPQSSEEELLRHRLNSVLNDALDAIENNKQHRYKALKGKADIISSIYFEKWLRR